MPSNSAAAKEGLVRLQVKQFILKNNEVRLRFSISDTGIGMSEEFSSRLFIPFEQAPSTISKKYGGTGLRLWPSPKIWSICWAVLIHVKSSPGKGTTITVELPVEIEKEAVVAKNRKLETLKVLVVDDEHDSCVYASLLLKKMGINARWVNSGLEAVKMVLTAHEACDDYDVCLVDWQMPDIDGVEITRRIRERVGPETLIIVICLRYSAIRKAALEAGANAFISKPLFASTLYNTLPVSVVDNEPANEQTENGQTGSIGAFLPENVSCWLKTMT